MDKRETAAEVCQEAGFTALLTLYFAYMFFTAFKFPQRARLFPVVLCLPGLFLGLSLLYHNWLSWRQLSKKTAARSKDPHFRADKQIIAFGLGLAYLAAVYVIGFILGTIVITLLIPYALGQKQIWKLASFSAVLLFFIWLIFHSLLMINFPTGLLGIV